MWHRQKLISKSVECRKNFFLIFEISPSTAQQQQPGRARAAIDKFRIVVAWESSECWRWQSSEWNWVGHHEWGWGVAQHSHDAVVHQRHGGEDQTRHFDLAASRLGRRSGDAPGHEYDQWYQAPDGGEDRRVPAERWGRRQSSETHRLLL